MIDLPKLLLGRGGRTAPILHILPRFNVLPLQVVQHTTCSRALPGVGLPPVGERQAALYGALRCFSRSRNRLRHLRLRKEPLGSTATRAMFSHACQPQRQQHLMCQMVLAAAAPAAAAAAAVMGLLPLLLLWWLACTIIRLWVQVRVHHGQA